MTANFYKLQFGRLPLLLFIFVAAAAFRLKFSESTKLTEFHLLVTAKGIKNAFVWVSLCVPVCVCLSELDLRVT